MDFVGRLLVFVLAVAPAFIMLGYFVSLGRGSYRDPVNWNGFVIATTIALPVLFVVILIEVGVVERLATFGAVGVSAVRAFLFAAIPEEAGKIAVILVLSRSLPRENRSGQLALLGASVGAGFAATENVFYAIEAENWASVVISRSATAVPSHVFTGVVMGALLDLAQIRRSPLIWGCVAYLVR